MESKYTPGIWVIEHSIDDPRNHAISAVDEVGGKPHWKELATVYRVDFTQFKGQGEANAQLISAAPELLEALIVVQKVLKPLINNPAHESVMQQIENAIAKATNPIKP